MQANILQCT